MDLHSGETQVCWTNNKNKTLVIDSLEQAEVEVSVACDGPTLRRDPGVLDK